ncbi:hypothetical protein OHA40_06210 [Nocardia sp. NBC_00508]|uniref:hypothetical protein n=1 Tax=Nocardia sp. NBC_00508 TaxID=2975992 RepID=UPI002E80224C|nr:hypothetical protein [Nocardia sp. NBC_00508]WUD67719.1 hypothetical protein OHA40_06210 [Nocardia sp. NBC_00508]
MPRPEAPNPRRLRHIRIESGELSLDYQAGAEQGQNVAEQLARQFPEITVTVDDNIRDDYPPSPCAQLWN